jgi:hypothetical protein
VINLFNAQKSETICVIIQNYYQCKLVVAGSIHSPTKETKGGI